MAAGNETQTRIALGKGLQIDADTHHLVRLLRLVPVRPDAEFAIDAVAMPGNGRETDVNIVVLQKTHVGIDDIADDLHQTLVNNHRPEVARLDHAVGQRPRRAARSPPAAFPLVAAPRHAGAGDARQSFHAADVVIDLIGGQETANDRVPLIVQLLLHLFVVHRIHSLFLLIPSPNQTCPAGDSRLPMRQSVARLYGSCQSVEELIKPFWLPVDCQPISNVELVSYPATTHEIRRPRPQNRSRKRPSRERPITEKP